jgi:hypothetical protein
MKRVTFTVEMDVGDTATENDIWYAVVNVKAGLEYYYGLGNITDSEEHAERLDLQGPPYLKTSGYIVNTL